MSIVKINQPVNASVKVQVNGVFKIMAQPPIAAKTAVKGLFAQNGLSAYQIALQNGFVGTEEHWISELNASSTDLSLIYNIAKL